MFNKQCKVKLIAASLGLAASLNASAAMGGLQVQSNLDEPFAGTVVVTGDEARALAGSVKPAVIGANLTATVVQQSSDRAVIRLRSSAPMKEPVVTFWLGVGNQNRQYTAMLDPKDYQAPTVAPQPARRAAQETPKPGRERAAEQPRRQSERERNRSRPAQAPARVEVVRGSRYQVKDGELLVDIAQRVQPEGMTLRQTINALVRANPKSFRNGNPDLMYSGTTLIIPEAVQLRRLARDSQIRVRAAADEAAAPSAQAAEQTAPATQTPPAAESATPPATPEQAAKPAETAEPVVPAVSEPVPAPVEATASEAVAVSEAAASEAAAAEVSEPVAPPVAEPAPAPAAETPALQEEQPDWMKWALYGAGGAVVLGGLAYLLSNRRRKPHAAAAAAGAPVDDEDDLFFEDINSPAPATDTQTAQTAAAGAVAEDDLHLNLDQLAEQQHLGDTPDTESVAAKAEAAAEEDDWSWLEDQTEEAVPFSPTAEPPSAEPATATTAAGVAAAATVAAKSADDWLNFGDEALPAAHNTPVAKPAPPVVEDDLDWVWEDETPPAEESLQAPAAEAELATQFVADQEPTAPEAAEFDFDLSAQPKAPASIGEVTAPVEALPFGAEEDDGLSFDVGEAAALAQTAHAAEQEAVSFETDWQPEVSAEEVSALDFAVDDHLSLAVAAEEPAPAPGFDDQAGGLDFNLDSLNFVDDAEPAALQAAEEMAAPATVEAADSALSFDTAFESAEVQPVDSAKLEAEALDWAEAVQQQASLPQEALEAKLELAKMYLEIDDANTARQTLMELVNESNGSSIQAQAQALLKELG